MIDKSYCTLSIELHQLSELDMHGWGEKGGGRGEKGGGGKRPA